MLYPIISYEDGTEVTASKPDAEGKVAVYTEKFDTTTDSFIFAEIILPDAVVKSSNGYSDKELKKLINRYSKLQNDIIGYVTEKVKQSA